MKSLRWPTILRWFCVLPAVALSFVASFFLSVPIDQFIHSQFSHFGLMPSGVTYLQFHLPWDGALAAALFILSGTVVAPGHKRVVSLALFVLGSLLTFLLLGCLSGPLHGNGPIFIGWTVAGTFAGGGLAITWIYFATSSETASKIASKSASNNLLKTSGR